MGSFLQAPNPTNHDAIYCPIHDLFLTAKGKKVLVAEESSLPSLDSGANSCVGDGYSHRWKFCEGHLETLRRKTRRSVSVQVPLRKLRWSTLVLQFDWSKVIHDLIFI